MRREGGIGREVGERRGARGVVGVMKMLMNYLLCSSTTIGYALNVRIEWR